MKPSHYRLDLPAIALSTEQQTGREYPLPRHSFCNLGADNYWIGLRRWQHHWVPRYRLEKRSVCYPGCYSPEVFAALARRRRPMRPSSPRKLAGRDRQYIQPAADRRREEHHTVNGQRYMPGKERKAVSHGD